jgi:hypothetical protein
MAVAMVLAAAPATPAHAESARSCYMVVLPTGPTSLFTICPVITR